MNLPNAITVGRIAVTPLIALLPLAGSVGARVLAFVLFIVAAVTDYIDGTLARNRNQITDLGKILDPLADKLLLLGTLIPMYLVGGGSTAWSPFASQTLFTLDPYARGLARDLAFVTPFGAVGLPLWIVLLVLGRELAMTIFRQVAARRGVVIAAIGPAKWKTGLQWVWVGSAYFWFAYATWLVSDWTPAHAATRRLAVGFAYVNGMVGTAAMAGAVVLTLWSLWLYVRRYGHLLAARRAPAR